MTGPPPALPPDDGVVRQVSSALEQAHHGTDLTAVRHHLAELAATSLGAPEVREIIKRADVDAVAGILARAGGTNASRARPTDSSVLGAVAHHTVTTWGVEWAHGPVRAVREFIDGLRDLFERPRFRDLRRPVPETERNRFDFVLDDPDFRPDPNVCDGKKWSEGGQRAVSRALVELEAAFPTLVRPAARTGKKNLQSEFRQLYWALRAAEEIIHTPTDVTVYDAICVVDRDLFDAMPRSKANYIAIRSGMYESVQSAFAEAGVPWEECFVQDMGDSLLILAPPTVSKAAFAGLLPHALSAAVRTHNESHPPEERFRLRLALHAGETTYDEHGVTGSAIIHACRLADAKPLRDALTILPGMLAVIASDWFYNEVIRHHPDHAPESYRPLPIDVKETSGVGWARLLDHEPLGTGVATGATVPALRPASDVFYNVVEALEAIPCMIDEQSRALVVEQLRFGTHVRYAPTRRGHVTSILRKCLDYEDGVAELVNVIAMLEPSGSLLVKRLVEVLTGQRT